MAKDPAFLFYPGDFLTGTIFFTDTEVGIYIKLLCAQHQMNGSVDSKSFDSQVPSDSIIRTKFEKDDEGYFNQRLQDEMVKRRIKSNNLSSNAKKRWSKHNSCKSNAIASDQHKPTEDENEDINIIKNKELIDSFENFWKVYKKDVGRSDCEEFWYGKKETKKGFIIDNHGEIILHAAAYAKSTPIKTFRKDPAKYLYNHTWEDEVIDNNTLHETEVIMYCKKNNINIITDKNNIKITGMSKGFNELFVKAGKSGYWEKITH